MVQVKFFEVRDSGTLIPVMVTSFTGSDHPLIRYAGFDPGACAIVLCKLVNCIAHYDPYDWPDNPRTMREAHLAIEKQWESLKDGDVIDVEFELGETTVKKEPSVKL